MGPKIPRKGKTGRKPNPKKSTPSMRRYWREQYYARKKKILGSAFILFISLILVVNAISADPPVTTVIEAGSLSQIYTYLVLIDGSNYVVKDGGTGEILYGNADASEAIQYCIDAPDTQTTIGFTDGTFVVTSRVDMTEGNLAFIGAGQGNTIIKLGYEGDLFYSEDGGDKILFKDLSIDGDKATRNTGNLIHLRDNTHLNFESIEVYDSPQIGIKLVRCQYIRLVDSYIHNNDEGEDSWEAGVYMVRDIHKVLVENCFFEDNNFDGLWIWSDDPDTSTYPTEVIISNNHWTGNRNGPYVAGASNGTHIERGRHLTIIGNIVHHSDHDGILVISWEDVTITGNVVYENGQIGGDGIVLDNCINTVISSNVAHNNPGPGIYLTDAGKDYAQAPDRKSKNHLITDNICYNNGEGSAWEKTGIAITGSTYVFVNGNKCFDDQAVKTQEYGIEVWWGPGDICVDHSDYIVITENDVRGNSIAGIRLQDNQGHNTVSDNYDDP